MTRLRKQTWIAIGVLLLVALVLRLNVRQGRIAGPSMMPTYSDGETVLVWKSVPRSSLKPGDVIIFRDNDGEELIKRIAFIRPWQSTSPTGDFVTVNGARRIPYPLMFNNYFWAVAHDKIQKPIPSRTVYVLGDNLLESDDSRRIGPISPSQILGKVIP